LTAFSVVIVSVQTVVFGHHLTVSVKSIGFEVSDGRTFRDVGYVWLRTHIKVAVVKIDHHRDSYRRQDVFYVTPLDLGP